MLRDKVILVLLVKLLYQLLQIRYWGVQEWIISELEEVTGVQDPTIIAYTIICKKSPGLVLCTNEPEKRSKSGFCIMTYDTRVMYVARQSAD